MLSSSNSNASTGESIEMNEFYNSSIIQVVVLHTIVSLIINVSCYFPNHVKTWGGRKWFLKFNLCNKMILEIGCCSQLGVSQYFSNN